MGSWCVTPISGELCLTTKRSFLHRTNDVVKRHVEPKAMRVLLALAYRQGEFVSKNDLIAEVWDGRPVSDDVLTGAVYALRSALSDDPRHPEFIETRRASIYFC